ncbi:MAG: DNA-binding NtrC family response regulator [Myxococcota bacterium]|jgi:DNA-binding NtrC family response regulator
MSETSTVLVVDDEASLRDIVRQELEDMGLFVLEAPDADAALGVLRGEEVDLVLTDVRMPGRSGTWLCDELSRLHPHIPVIVMTGYGSVSVAVEALRAGAYDFLSKPFKSEQLEAAIQRALETTRMRREIRHLRRMLVNRRGYDRIIGQSAAMQAVFDLIDRVAQSSASVLIAGESGVGKELVARAIHNHSRFNSGPFVPVNCAALPPALVESELFGHERGSFSGAIKSRRGLIREAEGGTLFLDEIAELPLEVQPKLLRALQERRVRPVGADRDHPFHARVLAATHQDLSERIHSGAFRADLYYRLAVVVVPIPPLRERREDVPLLAEHFLDAIVEREEAPQLELSEATLGQLAAYDWPGNVRELHNAIEHAFMMAHGRERINADDLPLRAQGAAAAPSLLPAGADAPQLASLAAVTRRHIQTVLDALNGNKSQAARVLDIDRKTLRAKIKKYGLTDSS